MASAATVAFYARMADARDRDPIVTPGEHGRADVASGKMSKWLRFNRAEDLVWVTDPEGTPRALTRKQLTVLQVTRSLAGTGQRVTMRELAEQLHVAPSTVYRAVVRLTAWGFISYQSNRGRLGGSVFILWDGNGVLVGIRDSAKATVRRWYRASEERISRLRRNVASCFPGREQELYQHRYSDSNRPQQITEWTPQEIAEALGE